MSALGRASGLALFCSLTGVSSAQLYVDVNGVPPGDGTQQNPYTSIATAAAAGSFLEQIFVAPGTYVESVVIPDDSPVEIIATGGHEVTIWKPATPSSIALEVFDMNFPTQPLAKVQGFTFTGADAGGIAVATDRNGAQVLIEDCIITGNSVGVLTSYEVVIENSVIVHNTIGLDSTVEGIPIVNRSIVWANDTDLVGFGQIGGCAGFAGFDENSPGFFNCVFGDPGLWDLDADLLDVHLAPGSPCIGAGPFGSDIGLYPYDPTYAPVATFCTGKLASQGCQPQIGASGSASLTDLAPFEITASEVVELKNGLFFYGYTRAALPFFGGALCTLPPNRRTHIQNAGSSGSPCSGSFTFDFRAHLQSGADPFLTAGTLAYGQYWFRDPQDPAGFQVGLTNALRFGIAP